MAPLPKGIRFGTSLAVLGLAMFLLPPQAAVPLGVLLVLGALLASGPNPATPIQEFGKLLYGG